MNMSSIEWTDVTWNPTTGCSKVSQGCKNCYAERLFPKVYPGRAFTDVRVHPDRLDTPLHWKKPRMVFVNSMSDLFHEAVPDSFIDRVFAVMAGAGRHTFQILTKRPERMLRWAQRVEANGKTHANLYQSGLIDYYSRHGVDLTFEYQVPEPPTPELRFIYNSATGIDPHLRIEDREPTVKLPECHWRKWPLDNVWLGVSVEDQSTADERIPLLLQTPAAVRFISYEPALGPVDLVTGRTYLPNGWCSQCGHPFTARACGPTHAVLKVEPKLDWVICGGESGPKARPCEIEWLESVVKQCKAARVACFVKQLGAVPVMEEERWHSAPTTRLLSANNAKRAPAGTVPIAMSDRKGKHIEEFPRLLQIREYPTPKKGTP